MQVQDVFAKRFTILQELGQGGMGIVVKAYDKLEGRIVAIKQVKNASLPRLENDPYETIDSGQVALVQEFRILASLRHPNIISVLDYGFRQLEASSPSPYFVMDYMQGSRGIVEASQDLNVIQKLGLAIQMLQALAYLHRRDILHLDLKPANVLCDAEDVKVVDFGLASKLGASHLLKGTLPYIAPERLLGLKALPASDLYAVGIIIYEMLFNAHPFGDSTMSKLLDNVMYAQPKLEPINNLNIGDADWDKHLEKNHGPEFFHLRLYYILGRLLDKNPDMRYQDAKSLINDISELLPPLAELDSGEIQESFIQAASFIGRENEQSLLLTSLLESSDGNGSFWLIGGESGIGKSRLIEEFRIHALTQGSLVLIGRGVKGGGTPYHYLRPILRHLSLIMDISDLEAAILKPVVPEIEKLLEHSIPDAPVLNHQETQRRFIETVCNIIQRYPKSLVIILEDLHWASETLEVLKALNFDNHALLVLGTYRDDERPDLPSIFPNAKLIQLAALKSQEIAMLSTSILGQAGNQQRIIDLLQRETEGNAYFLVEVIRALAEMAGQLDKIANMSLPTKIFARGIQDIVERRLERVPEYCLQLLRLAAVNGRELDLALLGNILENNKNILPISLDTWLNIGAEAAILEVHDNTWRFVHEHLREGILSKIEDVSMPALHYQVAQSIEQIYPQHAEFARKLVFHWHLAHEPEKEYRAVKLAAKFAQEQGISLDAIEMLERAIVLYDELSQNDASWLANAHYQLGRVYTFKGLYTNAASHYDKASSLLATIDEPTLEAEILRGKAHLPLWQGQLDEALTNTLKLLEFANQKNFIAHQVDAHNYLNAIYMMQGKNDAAQTHIDKAWELIKDSDDIWRRAVIKNAMGEFAASLEQYSQALAHYQEAAADFQNFGDKYAYAAVTINIAHCYMAVQDIVSAKEFYKEALQIAVTIQGMLPLSLGAVAGYAHILAIEGQASEAASLIAFVINHPSTYHDPIRTAEQARKEVQKELTEQQIDEAASRYSAEDYRSIVECLLA